MQEKVKWAILGVAKISRTVIPAMQRGQYSEVVSVASRDLSRAKSIAAEFGIRKAFGSYEEAIADSEVEAVYIPLPNHMHVPWSIRAAEAGKHVLCEKPVAMNSEECRRLINVRDRANVQIGEAFMVRTHPQWLRVREIVRSGEIGDLRGIICAFSFFNTDPQNIRNIPEYGGGAMMDLGCYPVQISRFLFGQEPTRVTARIDSHPQARIDRLTSGILEFPSGHCVFSCSIELVKYQRVQILGAGGRIEIEIPFNAPNDRPTRISIDRGDDLYGGGVRFEELGTCDQYTIQGDRFSEAIRRGGLVPTPLEDSLANTEVIDAVFESARSGRTVALSP